MAKQISNGRIRSEVRKGVNGSFLGNFPSYEALIAKYPNKKDNKKGKKDDDLLGATFDNSSFAFVDDGVSDPVQYKYDGKKWKKLSGGGGSSPLDPSQQALIDAWSENDTLYIGDNPESPQELDWKIIKKGVYLYSYQWVEGKWKEYSKIGGSTQIDTLILKGLRASIYEVNDNGEKFNIWRTGSTPQSNIFGSSQRRIFVLADGRDRVDIAYSGNPVTFEPSPLGSTRLNEVEMNFEFDYSRDTDTEVMYATHNLYRPTKARFSVMDITDGKDKERLIYESKNLKEFRLEGGDLVVGIDGAKTGTVKLLLNDRIFFIVGRRYRLTAQCLTINDCGFEGMNKFPWVKMDGHESLASMVATEEWIKEQPFSKPQSLQQTLNVNNMMDINTNISLVGAGEFDTFNIKDTTYSFSSQGTITFDDNGYLLRSLNLSTPTPQEPNRFTLDLNPSTSPISPKLLTFQVVDVPNEQIDLPKNISFSVLEMDGRTTGIEYDYIINKNVAPMHGIFYLKLDGRKIKNVSMMITKPSRGSAPDLSKMGYMKVINGYSGDVLNLFEKIDEQYKINPSLIKNQFVDIPDSTNIKPADEKKITTDSIYRLPEDIVGKVESLPIDQRFDVLKMKNVDTLVNGVFKGVMSSLDVLKDAKKGDYWKNTTTSKITLVGIDFNTNDELFCISTIIGTPTDLSKFQKVPFVSDRVQSNWTQTDSGSPEYIKNKPTDLITEANSDNKVYGRKNKSWIPLADIQEPTDTFKYLRTLGKWVIHEDKFNICAFGDKKDYLKDEFASYNKKLYRALKDTFRSPDYTYLAKVDTGVPQTLPYPSTTGAEYPQIQILVPFISKSNETITGFRLNISTTAPIDNSYICLAERVMSNNNSVAKILSTEIFTATNGDNAYVLKTPLSVLKDKNYELFLLLPSVIPFTVLGSSTSVLENAIFKVGLVEGTPYSTAFDQRLLADKSVPTIGGEYRMHQGTWSSGIMCLTPIIASTTVKDWIEVVGSTGGGITEVHWKDILDKPEDILTDKILAETNRPALTMDSHGNGLMASTDNPELPKIGLIKYDIPSQKTMVGNNFTDVVIQSDRRILSKAKGTWEIVQSEIGTSNTKLKTPEFVIPFIPMFDVITPSEITLTFEKATTLTLIVHDIEVLSGVKVNAGINNITIPPVDIQCKIGRPIDMVIQAGDVDNPCFMGEITGEGETAKEELYYRFAYTTYKISQVLTSDLANKKLLLERQGKIQVPSAHGDTLDILSLDRDMIFVGNMKNRTALLSKEKPFLSYVNESLSILSMDTEDPLPAKNYSATLQLKKKDVEYVVDSIKLNITKPSMIRAMVNGIPYGDYRQPMPAGDIVLKPYEGRQARVNEQFKVELSSAISGVFVGLNDKENPIPKFTVDLFEPVVSRVASEQYAHTVNISKISEEDNLPENYRVTGSVQQVGIVFPPERLQYTVPSRCKQPRLDYRNQRDIYFDGDYKMIVNEDLSEEFIVKFPSFKTGYTKTRIEAYLDVYKQEGFISDMVAEDVDNEETKKVFSANSAIGKDLNEKHNTVWCSQKNIEYHSFFDYYEGDEISFRFGKNVDFSNCYMVMDIHMIGEDPDGTSYKFGIDLLNTSGNIKASAIQDGTFVTVEEYNKTLRKLDTINGDNIYLSKTFVSSAFNPLEPQRSDSVFFQVPPNSKVLLPTIGAKNEYVATNLEACNIVGEDYLKFVIRNFGGVMIENQNVLKMVVRIYKLNRDTPIKYNLDSILLTTVESEAKLDYEYVNNEYKDYYEIEYRVNGAPSDQFVMKVGDGNDWTNLSVVLFFAGLRTDKDEIPMFNKSLKINPELYDGWDSKVDLTNGENITLLTPNEEKWKHIDFNTIKVETMNMGERPEIRTDSGGMYIYYYPDTVLNTAGQMIQYTIPVPEGFEQSWADIEICFDETRENKPHINPEDFYVVGSGDSEKTIREEYMTTILTIKSVPMNAQGTPIIIRGVAHPSMNNNTNISETISRFITFRTNGNRPKEVPMFVDNKINKVLYDGGGSGWDMKVDLTAQQNINITRQSPTTTYTTFHTIPFKRLEEWKSNEYIAFSTRNPQVALTECTHFTIKGIDPPSHYTDTSVKYRLEVKDENGVIVVNDCVACTGLSEVIYNKIKSPIPKACGITLLCNSLADPFSYLPSDAYDVEFYKSNGGIETAPLFNPSTGLLNPNMMPKGIVYLSDKLRIRGENFAFVFEANYTGDTWKEISRMN